MFRYEHLTDKRRFENGGDSPISDAYRWEEKLVNARGRILGTVSDVAAAEQGENQVKITTQASRDAYAGAVRKLEARFQKLKNDLFAMVFPEVDAEIDAFKREELERLDLLGLSQLLAINQAINKALDVLETVEAAKKEKILIQGVLDNVKYQEPGEYKELYDSMINDLKNIQASHESKMVEDSSRQHGHLNDLEAALLDKLKDYRAKEPSAVEEPSTAIIEPSIDQKQSRARQRARLRWGKNLWPQTTSPG
ncbi:hypothetical protein KSF_096930 [Reticulibacter mediterranei]|uniref:Uncharacterized protein n=1 Tax=Reticulibacter mediterranei TaxID=2778369 RepID=A0A8J3IZJ2_9CHLR|nr:hypothetical protein [Reticulibacter mediterranei]GHO99645.1 hypothetical protein KSF_096930 [Reticulibacter mediterranei]